MGPQFYKHDKGASFVPAVSHRELNRWGNEVSRWGIQASRSRVEGSRCATDSSSWNIDFTRWGIESSRGRIVSSSNDVEYSGWDNDYSTYFTSQADPSSLPQAPLATLSGQQHLTPPNLASSAHVVVKQAPSCGLSVKPSKTSESSNGCVHHHKQIRVVRENTVESKSSDIGDPRMDWNMDFKLITKEGTIPYFATGQTLFESEVYDQGNPSFAAARVELGLVSCESDTITCTTRSTLDQTSDKDESATDLSPDVTGSVTDLTTTRSSLNLASDIDGSVINLTSDTDGSVVDLTSDTYASVIDLTSDTGRMSNTGGSVIDLTSDTDGSGIELRSDTNGSVIEVTADTDESVTDLTSDTNGPITVLSSVTDGSHLSAFPSQCQNSVTLQNPTTAPNCRPLCLKRQETIATPLSSCQGRTSPRRDTKARSCDSTSDVELSKTKHPQIKMSGVCLQNRKTAELENLQENTPVKKIPLQCNRGSSWARKYVYGDREHTSGCCEQSLEPPPVPRIGPTRPATSRRTIGQTVSWASPNGEWSDGGGAAACSSKVKRRLFANDPPSPGHEDKSQVTSL